MSFDIASVVSQIYFFPESGTPDGVKSNSYSI